MTAGPLLSRRQVLAGLALLAGGWRPGPALPTPTTPSSPAPPANQPVVTETMEAFADTVIPGTKRWPGDRAIAGAAPGPGAVQAGALHVFSMPEVGLGPSLPALAAELDARATAYAAAHARPLDPTVPPFVALGYADRKAVVEPMLDPSGPDYEVWLVAALMVFLAFHCAAHLHTPEAVRAGHPGLAWLGFPQPDADGLWRFPEFSYRRRLAREHPRTTRTGQPT